MSRVAVVTGGASGMGLGIARRFAEAGHRVAVLDVQSEAVQRATDELGVTGQVANVGDRAAVDAALDAVRRELGPIEILVTSAGIDADDDFTAISADRWEQVLRVNLTGTSSWASVPTR